MEDCTAMSARKQARRARECACQGVDQADAKKRKAPFAGLVQERADLASLGQEHDGTLPEDGARLSQAERPHPAVEQMDTQSEFEL